MSKKAQIQDSNATTKAVNGVIDSTTDDRINKVKAFIQLTQGKSMTKLKVMEMMINDGYQVWEARMRETIAA